MAALGRSSLATLVFRLQQKGQTQTWSRREGALQEHGGSEQQKLLDGCEIM